MKDLEHRANEARRLLDEPLLKEALQVAEKDTIEEMLALPFDADEQRRELALQVQIIRGVSEHLKSIILTGKAQKRFAVV